MELTEVEIRVLGCLLEKQRTTPDAYPLSLNALQNACNQSTNRDPVVSYEEATIREALGSLGRRRWVRSGAGHGGRALKYRQLFAEELGLPEQQLALLAVLMLRGAQTPGELKQRAGRLHPFGDLDAVGGALEGLIERELVERLPRRPGQKEERYRHLLDADAEPIDPGSSGSPPTESRVSAEAREAQPAAPQPPLERRVQILEAEVAELKRLLANRSGHE